MKVYQMWETKVTQLTQCTLSKLTALHSTGSRQREPVKQQENRTGRVLLNRFTCLV
jgi:hypothetical protein